MERYRGLVVARRTDGPVRGAEYLIVQHPTDEDLWTAVVFDWGRGQVQRGNEFARGLSPASVGAVARWVALPTARRHLREMMR